MTGAPLVFDSGLALPAAWAGVHAIDPGTLHDTTASFDGWTQLLSLGLWNPQRTTALGQTLALAPVGLRAPALPS